MASPLRRCEGGREEEEEEEMSAPPPERRGEGLRIAFASGRANGRRGGCCRVGSPEG